LGVLIGVFTGTPFILSLTFLLPAVSHAARDYGRNPADFFGQVYFATKYGEITIAEDLPENGSDIRNVAFVFGKGLNDVLSMEFEYSTTVSEDDDYFGGGYGASADTLGLFLAAKTPGKVYVKGRVGYAKVKQEFGDDPLIPELGGSKNVYGVAVGIGAGVKVGKRGAVEVEYTIYPTRDDVETVDLETDFIGVSYVWSTP